MPKSIFRRFTKRFFILSNLLVALLFLAGCYNEIFSAAFWWPIGFLTLALFYLLIVLFIFFIFWLFVKPGWATIFIITVAVSFQHITNIIPLRLSQPFNIQKSPSDLRVMSWNVAQFDIMKSKTNPNTYQEMINLVNQYQPDVACFQEMVSGDTLADLNTPYYKQYTFYSIFEFANKLNFPDYLYSYNYKENFMNQQHFGLIIFSKYPIINKQTLRFFPNDYNSTFQYVDIVKETDTIRVFNLHLQSLRFSTVNLKYIDNPSIKTDTGLVQSKSLISKLKNGFLKRRIQAGHVKEEIDKSPYPVVVCGDFNDVPNSYSYETIGDGLQDAFVKKGFGIGRTFSGIAPTLRIDHIFVDKRYAVNQYVRIPKKLSDHFPIIADISHLKD
ncbi:MAG: endonuclease/exonuclease/phosphatase family protein [Ferruginibacter sp.]